MSGMRIPFLKIFNFIGDHSGCHQMPERSFKINGYIFPMCARCTGVSVGQIMSLITGFCGFRLPVIWCSLFLAAMGVDWAVQYIGIQQSTNTRRFITGIMGGFGLFQIYFHIFDWVAEYIF